MVNFGPLAAETGSLVWGTPANFNGFRVLASIVTSATSLNGSQPTFVRCLAVSWAGTLYIHFRGLLPLTEFCQVQNSVCVQVLRCPILPALLHGTRVVGVSQTAALSRGRHLYTAGRPSRWALAHISSYSYCDFVRTLHKAQWLLVSSSSSSSFRFYAF